MTTKSQHSSTILSFDVGGSHISAALCDRAELEILQVASAPLDQRARSSDFAEVVYLLGNELMGGVNQPTGAVLAVPGPFDFDAGVSYMQHKLVGLHGADLRHALAYRFGWTSSQFLFLNDAHAFLLGEITRGAAQRAERAVGIPLGTGIGSAFAVGGQYVTQGEGVPPGGEIWNLPYGNGIVEDLISTRAIRSDYNERTGQDREVESIADASNADLDARLVFEMFGTHLGQVLRATLATFNPDVVVIGGGISRSAHLFLPQAQAQLIGSNMRLVTSALLANAPLLGGAVYWMNRRLTQHGGVPHKTGEAAAL